MNMYYYIVKDGEFLNKCVYNDTQVENFVGKETTFTGVRDEFNEIVFPIRHEYVDGIREREFILDRGEFKNFYFPFENNRIEFSGFFHTPKVTNVSTKFNIISEEAREVSFELGVAGGVVIWVNGVETHKYQPHVKNVNRKTEVKFDLTEGSNEVVIELCDICERNTMLFYQLKNISGYDIEIAVPIGNNDEARIKEVEKTLMSCYLTKDSYLDEDIILGWESNLVSSPIEIKAKACKNRVDFDVEDIYYKDISLDSTQEKARLFDCKELDSGTYSIYLQGLIGDIKIKRKLFTGVQNSKWLNFKTSDTIDGRKKQLLDILANEGQNIICKAIAILETEGKFTEDVRRCIEVEKIKIVEKRDCCDFRVPVLQVMYMKYGDLLPEDVKEELKELFINFRYWTDEPGNDAVWYFSENHSLMFHLTQYISGHLFPTEKFTVSNRLGNEQKEIGYERLVKWFDSLLANGFSEWNSATYFPIDFIGLFALYETAPDTIIKEKVIAVLDMIFPIIRMNNHKNVYSTTFGRVYEKTIKDLSVPEINNALWVSWGLNNPSLENFFSSLYCISDYIPKDMGKYMIGEGESRTIEYVQGEANIYIYLYKTLNYSLGSALKNNPYEWGKGYQEHSSNLVLDDVTLWVNNPGENVYSGDNRPSYWTGNGTNPYIEQYENILFMNYNLHEMSVVRYIHMYAPLWKFSEYEITEKWFFARKNDSYVGVYFQNGFELTKKGVNKGKELVSHGKNNNVILKAGSKEEFGSYASFVDSYKKLVLVQDENKISFGDCQHGKIEFEIYGNLKVEGKVILREASKERFINKKK